MKKIVWFFIFFLLTWLVNAQEMMCTMEYSPVCAEKQVQCIKAPCFPIKQTYWNSCMAKWDNAKILYNWECLESNVEKKIDVKLNNFFSKFNESEKITLKTEILLKVNILLKKTDLNDFSIQVFNYIKYYLVK